MKKVLFTANTDRHILLCHLPYLKYFQENNYEVHVATNTDSMLSYTDKKIKLYMKRNPFSLKNIKAVFQLYRILKNNHYDLIHTHTPVGSVVTRLACMLSKTKSKVIYTCHGFHFYKGAPIYYWLLFYPIEKFLMRYVDILILMNNEDYLFAKKHFKKLDVRLVNGVGFDRGRLDRVIKKNELNNLYKLLGISKNDFVVSYIAEYSYRKRQIDLINELAKTDIANTNIRILLIGDDSLNGKLKTIISKKKMEKNIILVDFTKDILPYLEISDLVISCSRQEGLPLNVMEAIYKKKFLIVSNCRGNVDLVKDGINGYVINDLNELYEKIKYVKNNYNEVIKNYNHGVNILDYSSESVLRSVVKIYDEIL